MGSLRVRHDWETSLSLFTFMHWRRKWQPSPVFLPRESQGWGAWWAAVCGVEQSQTRLKRLSSSSSSSKSKSDFLSRMTCLLKILLVLLKTTHHNKWLKLKKVGKTSRPFRYDLNQIPCDYTVEVTNRFKELDLIDLNNYEWRFVTLYRRQWPKPSQRKKKQEGKIMPYK